jgi:hypothetical protein
MPKDLEVALEDRPGQLARLGEVLGKAKVNIAGACAVTAMGKGSVHLLFDDRDVEAAKQALAQAGIPVQSEQEVLVRKIVDRPGALGRMARRLADAGVNITLFYLATDTRAVFGVSDLQKAKKAFRGR